MFKNSQKKSKTVIPEKQKVKGTYVKSSEESDEGLALVEKD